MQQLLSAQPGHMLELAAKLVDEGRFEEACTVLRPTLLLDRSTGRTQTFIGMCMNNDARFARWVISDEGTRWCDNNKVPAQHAKSVPTEQSEAAADKLSGEAAP